MEGEKRLERSGRECWSHGSQGPDRTQQGVDMQNNKGHPPHLPGIIGHSHSTLSIPDPTSLVWGLAAHPVGPTWQFQWVPTSTEQKHPAVPRVCLQVESSYVLMGTSLVFRISGQQGLKACLWQPEHHEAQSPTMTKVRWFLLGPSSPALQCIHPIFLSVMIKGTSLSLDHRVPFWKATASPGGKGALENIVYQTLTTEPDKRPIIKDVTNHSWDQRFRT